MTMADDVDLEEFVMAKDELSGADIKVRLSCQTDLILTAALYKGL